MPICANSDYDSGREGNKLAEYRYFRINVPATGTYTVTINTTTPTPPTNDPPPTPPDVIRDQSDPDMYVYRDGVEVARGWSGEDNQEVFQVNLTAGVTYVADLQEWRFEDDGASSDFPERICFEVTIAP